MARILVVEDDPTIGANLCDYLGALGHACDWAHDGLVGMALATQHPPELVVLDLNLPRLDGLTWCRRFREELGSHAPVIMLTARDELGDKLAGFAAGADDYLVKPFQLAELAVRVDALLRRAQGRTMAGALRIGALELNRHSRTALFEGREVRLTPKPFRLLELLAEQPGRVLSREALETAVWGESQDNGDALRALVAATRKAFLAAGCDGDPIENLHGHGYRIRES